MEVIRRCLSWYNVLFFAVLMAALFLRLRPAVLRPLIFDEAFTIMHLIRFDHVVDIIKADPSVPPLHYLLIKLLSLLSLDLLWLRLPSIIFSMLSLLTAFIWLKPISKKVALITVILLSFSAFQLTYAWQAYVYSQLFFFGIMSSYLFYQLFYFQTTRYELLKLVGLIIFSLAAFFTHYGFIWTLIGFFLEIIKRFIKVDFQIRSLSRLEKNVVGVFVGICILLSLYTPFFIRNYNRALSNISWFPHISANDFGITTLSLFGFYDSHDDNASLTYFGPFIAPILFFILIVTLAIKVKKREKYSRFCEYALLMNFCYLLLPIIVSFSIGQSIYAARTLIVGSFFVVAVAVMAIVCIVDDHFHSNVIIFGVLVCLYIINCMTINRNESYIFRSEEVSKQYAAWFREYLHLRPVNSVKLLLLDEGVSRTFPHIGNAFTQTTFDYYWYGYDGHTSLQPYTLVTNNIFSRLSEQYYLVVIQSESFDTELNFLCPRGVKVYEYYDTQLGIYSCNEPS